MKIDDFLSRLEKVTPNGAGSWMACCPAHADKNPSMSVSQGDKGIVVHCHAGCAVEDICGAMGLKVRDLFDEPAAGGAAIEGRGDGGAAERAALGRANKMARDMGRKRNGKLGEWVCDYVYHDADGVVIFKQSRYKREDGKKTFVLKHPDPAAKGGWGFGLKSIGRNRVVYHLPEVLKAAKAGRWIVVAEGEKDVDNLRALGFTATCNVCGAGEWGTDFPEGWGAWFAGAKGVLIVADKDDATIERKKRGKMVVEPFLVGQKHALDVARQLRAEGFAGQLRICCMPDVGGVKCKDFTEWRDACLATGVTVDGAAFKAALGVAGVLEPAAFAAACGLTFEGADAQADAPAAGERPAELAPAEKGGRKAASDSSEEEGEASAPGAAGGRFGRLGPRAPDTRARRVEVGFNVTDQIVVMLDVTCDESVKDQYLRAVAVLYRKVKDTRMFNATMWARLRAWVTVSWLLSRGEFFWDENDRSFSSCMYIDYGGGSNTLMRISSDEFLAFVAREAEYDDVDAQKGDMKKALGLIKQIAVDKDYSRGVVPSSMWDRRGDAAYISNDDGRMYRLKDGRIDLVDNGTDGVVFLRGRTLAPWKLVDGPGIDPFEKAEIFTGANWGDSHGAMNVRLWVLNLFACHVTKPILLITGLAQSGKTRMAKAIKEILGMRLAHGEIDRAVQQIEKGDKGLEAFWVTINDGKLEVFDNFDTKVEWASDALQNAATDGQTKRRTLYKTDAVTVLRANASLILTSNNPMFLTDGGGGMADRIIRIPLLSKVREVSKDSELAEDIVHNRDAFMTWIARTVAAAMADKVPVEKSVNKRHPDYGKFAVKCGRAMAMEHEVIEALGSSESAKALMPLRQDKVASAILDVLKGRGYVWERFTSGEMSACICQYLAGDDDADKLSAKYPPVVIGKVLSKYARQFETLFYFSTAKGSGGRFVYHVKGLSKVGEVELKRDFQETPKGASENNFTRNGALSLPTPPNAPYARAPTPTPYLDVKEKKEDREIENEDYGGGIDDLDF